MQFRHALRPSRFALPLAEFTAGGLRTPARESGIAAGTSACGPDGGPAKAAREQARYGVIEAVDKTTISAQTNARVESFLDDPIFQGLAASLNRDGRDGR